MSSSCHKEMELDLCLSQIRSSSLTKLFSIVSYTDWLCVQTLTAFPGVGNATIHTIRHFESESDTHNQISNLFLKSANCVCILLSNFFFTNGATIDIIRHFQKASRQLPHVYLLQLSTNCSFSKTTRHQTHNLTSNNFPANI